MTDNLAAPGENLRINGDRLWDTLMDMAKIGPGIAGGNNRQTLTDADAEGRTLFKSWCDAAGMTMGVDAMGTMFATRPGTDPDALPEIISKEPLGPAVRRGDDEWFAIVKWVVQALVEAEELGITQAKVDALKTSPDPAVQRFLGVGEDLGKSLGLDREWAARAVKAGGNYGEIFERNVGAGSPLKLPRGLNAQWNKGGLMYGLPLR